MYISVPEGKKLGKGGGGVARGRMKFARLCIGYFEATRGYVNKHISPRCLKITYLFFTVARLR